LERFPSFTPKTTTLPMFFAMQRICQKEDGAPETAGKGLIEVDDPMKFLNQMFENATNE
jgi:hypothetical protein